MIFLLLPLAAALGFAALVFIVATHKPFVSPRERRLRMILRVTPIFILMRALFGPPRWITPKEESDG